jgi:pantetheine-phosphate adenylyltransferase
LPSARLRTASTSLCPHDEDVVSRKPKELPMAAQGLSLKSRTKGRELSRSVRPYKLVALGGTFDVLHAGHRHLLSEAFKLGDVVLVGVTTDRLVATLHKKHQVRPFSSRVRDLNRFLKTRRWSSRARVTALGEPYGPAASRKKLQALIVSKSTLASGRRLNRLRRQNGLQPLDLFAVDLLSAADGKPISTTRIMNREIDLQGRVLKTQH